MKKFLALFLAFVVVFAFAACGSSDEESSADANNESVQSLESTEEPATQESSEPPTESSEQPIDYLEIYELYDTIATDNGDLFVLKNETKYALVNADNELLLDFEYNGIYLINNIIAARADEKTTLYSTDFVEIALDNDITAIRSVTPDVYLLFWNPLDKSEATYDSEKGIFTNVTAYDLEAAKEQYLQAIIDVANDFLDGLYDDDDALLQKTMTTTFYEAYTDCLGDDPSEESELLAGNVSVDIQTISGYVVETGIGFLDYINLYEHGTTVMRVSIQAQQYPELTAQCMFTFVCDGNGKFLVSSFVNTYDA